MLNEFREGQGLDEARWLVLGGRSMRGDAAREGSGQRQQRLKCPKAVR